MTKFDSVWAGIREALHVGQTVRNWGHARGYTGGDFRVEDVSRYSVTVFGGNMTQPRVVSRGDFEKVYWVWDDYVAGEYPREAMTKLSQNTTYILSILHLV